MRTPEAALVDLQRSVTPDDIWVASKALLQAVAPGRYHVLGLPSLGITPMFLRTTMPTRDMGRFAELAPLNRVIATKPGLIVARMSDFYKPVPGDPFYEEFLVPDGWLHATALLFWRRDRRFIGQLATLRTAEQGDFKKEELARLRQIHPQVNAAMQRLLDLQNSATTQITIEHSLNALPLPLAVVAWDLSIGFINKAGRVALQSWLQSPGRSRTYKPAAVRLPEAIHDACQELKASMSSAVRSHDHTRLIRELTVTHPHEPGSRATIRLVEPPGGRALHPSWIIHFETTQPLDREVAHALLQFTKLSVTEKSVVMLAAGGHDNDTIATKLGRSRSTVRTHLRNIFRKLGITSRARLAPLLQALQA